MFEVHKIYLGPAVKMGAALGFAATLAGVLVIGVIAAIAGSIDCMDGYCGLDYNDAGGALMFLLIPPFVGAVGGALLTLIAVPLYNVAAKHFGGIALDLRKGSSSLPSPESGNEYSRGGGSEV